MMHGRLPGSCRATGLSLVAILLITPCAMAQAAYVLDRSSSRVTFQGRAFLRSIVGQSNDLAGTVSIRRGDVRSVRGNAWFPVTSLDPDPAMQSRELGARAGADLHPDIVFPVDSIAEPASHDNKEWAIHRRLTMNDVTRPVSLLGTARFIDRRMVANDSTQDDLHD